MIAPTTLWLLAGAGVCVSLIPCAWMCLQGKAEQRLVGLEMTSLVITLAFILFTVWSGRLFFIDLALTMALMSFGGSLVFARFLEKHL